MHSCVLHKPFPVARKTATCFYYEETLTSLAAAGSPRPAMGYPHQVPDKWGSANFRGVCDEHDRCYYTLGSSRDSCNNAFCDGLVHACKRAYCRGILGCLPALFPACNVAATTYCDGVRAFAGVVYPAAQTLQTEYEQCIRDNGPVIVPGACSNGRPPGAEWQQGKGCGRTWWECRNGQIKLLHGMRSPCIEH
jgi:hypothetical protein